MSTNEEIALKLGWTSIMQAGEVWWHDPISERDVRWHKHPPDYEHDKALAGQLLIDLVLEFSSDITTDDEEPNFFMFRNGGGGFTIDCCRADGASIPGVGKDEAQAISRAWLAWKKEEK